MIIYNYDKETNEYLNKSEARLSPLEEGVYLIPAFATSITPLKSKEGFSQIFNEEVQRWEYIEDNRGKIYITSLETLETGIVTRLGKLIDLSDFIVLLEDLEKDEDGHLYKYYKDDFTPDIDKIYQESLPTSISRLQAKLYLLDSGYYDQVMALIEQDTRLQIYWNDVVNFNKNDVILKGVQSAIGLTDEQLDTMFLEASKI